MNQEWRRVLDFPGYEVSDQGEVQSLDRVVQHGLYGASRQRGRILALTTMPSGHKQVGLNREGKAYRKQVHKLVLEAFEGPCPDGMEACHGPGGPGDNRRSNLRWDTRSGNVLDQVSAGTHNMASKTHCKHQHPFSPENTWVNPRTGSRACRTCKNDRKRAARVAKRNSLDSTNEKEAI